MPKTMSGLFAAGGLLATVPLLAAVLLAGMALERQTRHTEVLVQEGLTVTRLGASLRDSVDNLERNARQYVALDDPALLDVIADRWRATETVLQRFEAHGLRSSILQVQQDLTEAEQAWNADVRDGNVEAGTLDRIHALAPQVDAIIVAGRAAIDAQMEQLRRDTAAARRVITLSALALIPLTALLAFGFSVTLMRPIRRLKLAIMALGHSRYEQPIAINYPREMQQVGENLDWLRRRLAQLEADKDRFLRHVSHELKTPLASLHEGAGLLHEGSLGPLTPRQKEIARILSESAAELGALIDNLLAYAEWRQERRQAKMTWFEVQPLIEEVLASQRLPMIRRALSAELDLRSPRLFGQRSSLRVAIGNLVANAVNHAPEGTAIEIHAAVRDGHCELSVRDNGRGVSDADKESIFEPFVRGTNAEQPGLRGTGVGLSIVKETALAHGGRVEVANAQPGARFKLEWPCPQP